MVDGFDDVLPQVDRPQNMSAIAETRIGIEACGSSHHWARTLSALGHEVVLIAPQHVKPYVRRNKNDAADAEAICEAMSRPRTRFVPAKNVEQQAALMLAGTRDALVRRRTQLTNMIRGHAAEFGLVAPRGLDKIEPLLLRIEADETLPALARDLFAQLGADYTALEQRLAGIEKSLLAWHRADEPSRRLVAIPSIGPIGASLLSMKVPDPRPFRTGRDFAAWLGLTPKDHGTAGRQRLGGITRAGDEILRSVLVAGATAVIQQVNRGRSSPSPWLAQMLARKKPKLAAVALANKTARIAWKMMVTGQPYDRQRQFAAPQAQPEPATLAA
jgi:transposase